MAFSKINENRFCSHFSTPNVWPFLAQNVGKIDDLIDCSFGTPKFETPSFILNEAKKSLTSNNYNQYGSGFGEINLRETLAKLYVNKLNNKSITSDNVQISFGAAGAFDIICRSFLHKDDEVVTIQPYFSRYLHCSTQFGAKFKTVNMELKYNKSDDKYFWSFDVNKLKKIFNNKTRLFILNTPHNPTGYVFNIKEMKEIELILKQYPNILVITDEVYEYMVYPNNNNNNKHISFASISKDMFNRTITISSASKTFCCTGWRLGWLISTKQLIKETFPAAFAHCGPGNHFIQHSMGNIIDIAYNKKYKTKSNYFEWLNEFYYKKYKLALDAVYQSGLTPLIPNGAFYIVIDVTNCINILTKLNIIGNNDKYIAINLDWQFVVWFAKNIGIGLSPLTGFCDKQFLKNKYFVRLSFALKDQQLIQLKKRFATLPKLMRKLSSSQLKSNL